MPCFIVVLTRVLHFLPRLDTFSGTKIGALIFLSMHLAFPLISDAVIDLFKVFTHTEKRYTKGNAYFALNNSKFISIQRMISSSSNHINYSSLLFCLWPFPVSLLAITKVGGNKTVIYTPKIKSYPTVSDFPEHDLRQTKKMSVHIKYQINLVRCPSCNKTLASSGERGR